MLKVIKRNGKQEIFNKDKIKRAIIRAITDIKQLDYEGNKYAQDIAEASIVILTNKGLVNPNNTIYIEDIQDMIEEELMKKSKYDVAKNFITYRYERAEQRYKANSLDKKIQDLIEMKADESVSNANKDGKKINTQRDLMAGILAKDYSLRKLLPKDIVEAHNRGDIYYHDLDYSPFTPMYNCQLIPFEYMFKNQFTIGNADVGEPQSIEVATALVSQIVANVASNIYGGTSFNRADEVLEKYAKKSYDSHLKTAKKYIKGKKNQLKYAKEETKKSIYRAMKSLEYEINTLFSSNGQTPFFTINIGLGTSWYAREIQKAIFKIRIKGLGKKRKTAIFPKIVFTVKKGLNYYPHDPNYDIKRLALECATKRMYPDALFYDKIVELTGDFKSPMGCRSFLSTYINEKGEYETDGRNNLGVVTVNLPRIAIQSKGDKKKFYNILNERLLLCKKALLTRINSVSKAKVDNAPILYRYGATGRRLDTDDNVIDIFKNGRATVSLGYIGIYEVGAIFYGGEWENNEEAKEFTLSIMKILKQSCDEWKKETGYGFSVYGTPAESLTHTFCQKDIKEFGIIENVTDKGYYTNSFHYDIRKKPTPFEKLDFESEYAKYSTGGFIHYCEFPSLIDNVEGLEAVWDYAYDKIGYFGTNTPIDKCYECGFEGEFSPTSDGFKCPQCGNTNPHTTNCTRRTCGYLGNPMERKLIKGRLLEEQAREKNM